jgi:prepilin-type N-terminal cleavage/methylation domain-containing protein
MKTRGFTLLEMLIALTLMGLLFTALFSAFYTLSRSWDATDSRISQTEDRRLIAEFLRRQLSQAMVVKITNDKADKVYAFEATAERIRYAAPLQPLQHQGGIFLIELSIVSSKAGKALEMRYAPYRPELTWDEAFKALEPVPIYDQLKDANFAYFGAATEGKEAEWQDEWQDIPFYPQMVKIDLADAQLIWPLLQIPLPQVSDYANPNAAQK